VSPSACHLSTSGGMIARSAAGCARAAGRSALPARASFESFKISAHALVCNHALASPSGRPCSPLARTRALAGARAAPTGGCGERLEQRAQAAPAAHSAALARGRSMAGNPAAAHGVWLYTHSAPPARDPGQVRSDRPGDRSGDRPGGHGERQAGQPPSGTRPTQGTHTALKLPTPRPYPTNARGRASASAGPTASASVESES